jgi:6-phosphogluconolactonase
MTIRDAAARPDVHVCEDAHDLATRVAPVLAGRISSAVQHQGRCAVALSGGNTPRAVYALLASTYREQIPWAQVHIFWGDERYVPLGDARSNYRMARDTLLERVPCPPSNVHPMPTDAPSPDDAACEYERTLRAFFQSGWPRFDVLLLGMGAEGHTASIFPYSPALTEPSRWVMPVTASVEPPRRLTLTLRALASAAHTDVLIAGGDKATALLHVLGDGDPDLYPAAALRSSSGPVEWWVDRLAARTLPLGSA